MINKVILVGRLGKDPIIRNTTAGEPFALISIATSHWTPKGTQTTWHSVIVFGEAAKALRDYGRKGRTVYVEGRLQYYKKVDNATGLETQQAQVCATQVQFLDNRPQQDEDPPESNGAGHPNYSDDDIPF